MPEIKTVNDEMTITFVVTEASVTQRLEIVNPDYSKEAIIDGLNEGTLATTMWHGKAPKSIMEIDSDRTVAFIVEQEVEGEYEDFDGTT